MLTLLPAIAVLASYCCSNVLALGFELDFNTGDGFLAMPLHHNDDHYDIEIEVGTPPQKLHAVLDTGSADLWLQAENNPFCVGAKDEKQEVRGVTVTPSIDCRGIKTFCNESSTTLRILPNPFYIDYADTFVDGSWATDRLVIGGHDVSGMKFGVGRTSNTELSGVLGVGHANLESVRGYAGAPNATYPNLPRQLKLDGSVQKLAYSVSLQKTSERDGEILFGAIDTSKYVGKLHTFPILNIDPHLNSPSNFYIALQGIDIQGGRSSTGRPLINSSFPALLDTGTGGMVVSSLAEDIGAALNATYDTEQCVFVIQCPTEDDTRQFNFNFGELQIAVPISNFVVPASGLETGQCALAIMPGTSETFALGIPFLKEVYTVFNLEDNEISMARANTNPQEPDIRPIPAGVPAAIRDSGPARHVKSKGASSLSAPAQAGPAYPDERASTQTLHHHSK
ncbi:AGR240Wp [Eremothecium gossypii ATCC 10895]|uniref:AGR240Wp n=1 Tax=Eremothecium gossypii (strain ATCC 10895 / CBS 109.51 / FGSC 9923 / NRRL Y-1056) TaxID=284811 RepID=Q74ZG7_EREGS|nr:AGR240Wp [Eremothecium gossypii ATCC 10895]AAS54730.2 AGR240Wp [Eremothecium gossypii ATCC 10895]